ncbi:MAG TPA: glycosyltransferase family 2 protein [Nocardioidaceae bacterium]|nr:glycosyltransferase family 2 protein [Nocardioidaceae bacterium]
MSTSTSAGHRASLRLLLIRILVVLVLSLGANYLAWRWLVSVNWEAWPIAVPLILAETYSFIDACLFGLTMWRMRERGPAPAPAEDATVDVFITTYNEPVELVMETALAAQRIRWPHETWVLDDGARPEMREAAEAAGIGYVTRSEDWADKPRHAKAGNLNNALFATTGEFLMILDADQIPSPDILHRTLGWFHDESVALVQTPQWFHNVDEADVLGSQAPLFYGPIQQGKDGWNAAFFCGSNAVLRREALMQIGVVGYVREVERAVRDALRTAKSVLTAARRTAQEHGPAAVAAVESLQQAASRALADLRAGTPVAEVTYGFQQVVDNASRGLVEFDVAALNADLAAISQVPFEADREGEGVVVDAAALDRLAEREWSPLGALESVRALVSTVDVLRSDEAQPVMPMATISVTEDMATAMRLHSAGWRTVYHHEILARGLAPEDLGSMLHQRLRWAQGTLQVMLRENPLVQKGLSAGQRLMYFGTMWSYLSGFAALAYIAAPITYFVLGILPVTTLGTDFMIRLIPFLIANQILFTVIGWRVKTWRGQQYSLALFPLWIRACATAVGNVWFGRPLGFVVTPKTKQDDEPKVPYHLIRPQIIAIGLLLVAAVVGVVRWSQGAFGGLPTAVNLVWIAYDVAVLGIVVRAARHRGYQGAEKEIPAAARIAQRPERRSRALSPVLLRAAVAIVALLVVAEAVLLLVRRDPNQTDSSSSAGSSAGASGDPSAAAGADPSAGAGGGASDPAAARPLAAEPPPEASQPGTYVETRVSAAGDVQVEQWVRGTRPLRGIDLTLPAAAPGDRPVRATDVEVAADRVPVDAPGTIDVAQARVSFDSPADVVHVRYTLDGVVERSASAPGRALVRALALRVRPMAGPARMRVTGPEVLSAACDSGPSAAPRPCGGPDEEGWTVDLRGPQRDDLVMAQVNLS